MLHQASAKIHPPECPVFSHKNVCRKRNTREFIYTDAVYMLMSHILALMVGNGNFWGKWKKRRRGTREKG